MAERKKMCELEGCNNYLTGKRTRFCSQSCYTTSRNQAGTIKIINCENGCCILTYRFSNKNVLKAKVKMLCDKLKNHPVYLTIAFFD